MKLARIVALSHHEKWDGSGFPDGISGEAIPIEGRIVAICDVFDALISRRPYKSIWSDAEAIDFLRQNAGKHFDPGWLSCSSRIFRRSRRLPIAWKIMNPLPVFIHYSIDVAARLNALFS